MEDSQDSFGRPNIRTDPRTGTAVYWNTQPSGNGMDPMAEWTNAPYGMVPSNDHSGRCQLHMSRHDQEHCFDGALPASDYYVPISQQEINDHGRGSLNPHAAQSEQFQDLSHELFEQSTHSSRYLMDHDAPLGDTFARPTTVPEEACGAEAVGSLGFDQAHHHNVHQLSALDMLDATGQAVFSSTADLREFPMSNSDSYWMNNGPRPAIPSGNNPWSQFTNRGIRPYPLLVNRSHVGYEQLSAQILGEANAPSVGSVSRRYKTDRNQRLELSHNSAEGISFSQSMPASPGPGRFVGRDLADHSSPEEARSPDTGSQEIVFDQHSGDPVSVKGKRIVPEDQRAESQWIRKNGGPCDRCRRGKRKVCSPSVSPSLNDTDSCQVPAISHRGSIANYTSFISKCCFRRGLIMGCHRAPNAAVD